MGNSLSKDAEKCTRTHARNHRKIHGTADDINEKAQEKSPEEIREKVNLNAFIERQPNSKIYIIYQTEYIIPVEKGTRHRVALHRFLIKERDRIGRRKSI
jgi:hypothetical protein